MRFFTTFFFTPFAFLMFLPPASRIEYILGRRPTYSAMGRPAHSSFIFPSTFFVGDVVQWVIRWVVRGVVELCVGGHVFVGVLRLDLEEETVGVGVEELTTIPVLPPELVVIEVIHQVLGEIKNAHPNIHRAIEFQTALVDLDSCQVVIEDIDPSKRRAGDEAPEFVLLDSSHQLHINPLPQVLHGLPEDRVVHQLVEVLLEVAGCLLPELSIFSDVRLHPRALVEPEGAMDRSQTQAQRHVQLQIPIVEHVAALVAEIGDQLLNLCWRHPNAEEVALILRHPPHLHHHAFRR